MQARPLLNTASLWFQTSFRKHARPLLSTASLSLAALWRFGAVPLLEALTLLDALALLEASPLWRFVVLRRLGALRLFDASWRSGNTAAMNTGDSACVSELAALRLCGFAASAIHGSGNAAAMNAGGGAWVAELAARRLCGFARSIAAFHGSFAALRLARSMAALRLCGLSVPWRLCGFAALTLFRVRACTRTRVKWKNSIQTIFQGYTSWVAQLLNNIIVWMVLYCEHQLLGVKKKAKPLLHLSLAKAGPFTLESNVCLKALKCKVFQIIRCLIKPLFKKQNPDNFSRGYLMSGSVTQ